MSITIHLSNSIYKKILLFLNQQDVMHVIQQQHLIIELHQVSGIKRNGDSQEHGLITKQGKLVIFQKQQDGQHKINNSVYH